MEATELIVLAASDCLIEEMRINLRHFGHQSVIRRGIGVLDRRQKTAHLYAGDLLDAEEMENNEIAVFENAGATAKLYTEELHGLFQKEFPMLNKDDFILHRGVNTCLFACPPLGLYTHGYQVETVEPVVRFYIGKLFQLWDDGVKCTPVQAAFFKRNKKSWQGKGSEFMNFKLVSATGN